MFSSTSVLYHETGAFTKIVTDYLQGAAPLRPFYGFPPSADGLLKAVERKRAQYVDRALLVRVLEEQYQGHEKSSRVREQIASLAMPHTFTVTTAHQPNLFTGPLYFIYKILHAIRLAEEMNSRQANLHFVPVFYMGSEDADLAELNHTWVQGKKLEWQRDPGGAVGRMKVDAAFIKLLDALEGQLIVEPHGREIIGLLRDSYKKDRTIQEATFHFVDALFGKWGLLVLIADHPELKRAMLPVFEDDLFNNSPSNMVSATSEKLGAHYNVQAHPREINLFYLEGNLRERIVRNGEGFSVHNTDIRFTEEEMRDTLHAHPERFSPNVILRGLFQETILPNVAFIGGGGELAYWLQLKDLFEHYNVPFPLLVLRNSFTIIESKWKQKAAKLGFTLPELFASPHELMNTFVKRQNKDTTLGERMDEAARLYEAIAQKAGTIDPGLSRHAAALKAKAITRLEELEKKMLRAEKRKYTDAQSSLETLKSALFPRSGLQERVENMSYYYARWGEAFLDALLQHSPAWDARFTLLTEEA